MRAGGAPRSGLASENFITTPRLGPVLPIALLVAAMCCFQLGATFAKGLFPAVGASGATALRTSIAAVLLIAVWRPRLRLNRAQLFDILVYGLALGFMNLSFYNALKFVPLGIGVALEFTGPLAVAVAGSRRPVDFVWILLAVLGLLALLPFGEHAGPVAPLGVGLALLAGACWALYIVYGRRAGAAHGGQTAALGMVAAAAVTLPVGLAQNGAALFAPALLPTAIAVAVVSSALPYSLEMLAMPRLPARAVGVLMSLEPAVAAIAGLLLLGERLSVLQWCAVACIMVASAGSATTREAPAAPA